MFTKGPFVGGSFTIIGSLNCDCTKLVFNGQYENKNIMLKFKKLQRKTKMCILQLKKSHVNKSFRTPLIHK